MDQKDLVEKILKLEYHQKLLLKMLRGSTQHFYKLIIEHSLTEQEVNDFYNTCDKLSKDMKEQKAEGFVYFHPLYEELKISLPHSLDIKEVIHACLSQQLYIPLMTEFKKYTEN